MLVNKFTRPHFLRSETLHLYSLQDLVEIKTSKTFISTLAAYMGTMVAHVTQGCSSCASKGVFCELCTSQKRIFSFQPDVRCCDHCKALLHSKCWNPQTDCPCCVRLQQSYQAAK